MRGRRSMKRAKGVDGAKAYSRLVAVLCPASVAGAGLSYVAAAKAINEIRGIQLTSTAGWRCFLRHTEPAMT
jgi:hypothetical protein